MAIEVWMIRSAPAHLVETRTARQRYFGGRRLMHTRGVQL